MKDDPSATQSAPKVQRVEAYGLARQGEAVLLVRVADRPRSGSGLWMLPGGGVEHGEAPERAVVREFAEETGYEVAVERLLDVGSDHRILGDGTDYHGVYALYEVSIIGGKARAEVGGSTDKVEWVPGVQARDLPMVAALRNDLDRWLPDTSPGEHT